MLALAHDRRRTKRRRRRDFSTKAQARKRATKRKS
jgi:hypothetical protein